MSVYRRMRESTVTPGWEKPTESELSFREHARAESETTVGRQALNHIHSNLARSA